MNPVPHGVTFRLSEAVETDYDINCSISPYSMAYLSSKQSLEVTTFSFWAGVTSW